VVDITKGEEFLMLRHARKKRNDGEKNLRERGAYNEIEKVGVKLGLYY
jgi:hypothetical protein